MLRDFGGGWPLARPLDHRRIPTSHRRRDEVEELVPLDAKASAGIVPALSVMGSPMRLPITRFQ